MTPPDGSAAPDAPRSTFVTVLAWLGIIMFGFGTLIGVAQNLMVGSIFQDPQFGEGVQDSLANAPFPRHAAWVFTHFRLLVFLTSVCVVLGLVASVGLLQRRNWARLTVITLLCLAIAWNLFSLVLQQHFFAAMPLPMGDAGGVAESALRLFRIMRVFMIVLTVGISILLGWIVARLVSTSIRAEFIAPVA